MDLLGLSKVEAMADHHHDHHDRGHPPDKQHQIQRLQPVRLVAVAVAAVTEPVAAVEAVPCSDYVCLQRGA